MQILVAFTIPHRSRFPFSAQDMVVYHIYKFKWMTRVQIQSRFREVEWDLKIRTARKTRLAYLPNRSRTLEVLVRQYLIRTRHTVVFADSDVSTDHESD